MKRRRYTGKIRCEFAGCDKVIGGSSKSGLFANYIRHTLANHEGVTTDWFRPSRKRAAGVDRPAASVVPSGQPGAVPGQKGGQ